MSTLTERAARRMARRALDGLLEPHLSQQVDLMWPVLAGDAEEAIRETLEEMAERWPTMRPTFEAFARENGLDPPPAEEQQP